MQLKAGDWTEIFKAGDYGSKGKYSEADLDLMVANFNISDQVPIVVGHPATDAPAWGWLAEVKRVGRILTGKVGELHKDFAQALLENKFRNRSVRIAKTPAGPKLLHLGFLGAVLPQVEGLKTSAQFAGECDLVDYGFDLPEASGPAGNDKEKTMLTEEQAAQLQADLKKAQEELALEKAARAKEKEEAGKKEEEAKAAEFAAWVDTEMVATGKIPAAGKDEVVAFMGSLPAGDAADFSVAIDGATKTYNPVEWFKGFVKALPTAEFTRTLPAGTALDFSRTGQKAKLVDLSHKV